MELLVGVDADRDQGTPLRAAPGPTRLSRVAVSDRLRSGPAPGAWRGGDTSVAGLTASEILGQPPSPGSLLADRE
jgi:hypothetical protein